MMLSLSLTGSYFRVRRLASGVDAGLAAFSLRRLLLLAAALWPRRAKPVFDASLPRARALSPNA
jgi:hypothetical protein